MEKDKKNEKVLLHRFVMHDVSGPSSSPNCETKPTIGGSGKQWH